MAEALNRGGFPCFKDTPIGKAPGVGYLEGMGVDSEAGASSNFEPWGTGDGRGTLKECGPPIS